MADFKKIEANYEEFEKIANFFVLHKNEENWLEGWIAVDKDLDQFFSNLSEEMNFTWDFERVVIEDYLLFQIDIKNKNLLKEIKSEKDFHSLGKQGNIFLVLLHKGFKYRIIENIPPVFDWFERVR
jgi:hypothetical protein